MERWFRQQGRRRVSTRPKRAGDAGAWVERSGGSWAEQSGYGRQRKRRRTVAGSTAIGSPASIFSSSKGQMGVFRPVVKPLMRAVLDRGHDVSPRCSVRAEFVGDDALRRDALLSQRRPTVRLEIRRLNHAMSLANPLWSAPRIQEACYYRLRIGRCGALHTALASKERAARQGSGCMQQTPADAAVPTQGCSAAMTARTAIAINMAKEPVNTGLIVRSM